MQLVWAGVGDNVTRLELPDPDECVLPGVRWGRPDEPMTPAYWAVRCRWGEAGEADFVTRTGSLVEEVAFCLLGGFGITYEVNAAAFDRLKAAGAFNRNCAPDARSVTGFRANAPDASPSCTKRSMACGRKRLPRWSSGMNS